MIFVFFKPRDEESWSETCENGEQGVSFAGHGSVSTTLVGTRSAAVKGFTSKANTKPCNERPPVESVLRREYHGAVRVGGCLRGPPLSCIRK